MRKKKKNERIEKQRVVARRKKEEGECNKMKARVFRAKVRNKRKKKEKTPKNWLKQFAQKQPPNESI